MKIHLICTGILFGVNLITARPHNGVRSGDKKSDDSLHDEQVNVERHERAATSPPETTTAIPEEPCYFSFAQKSELEEGDRYKIAEVSKKCTVGKKMKTLKELQEEGDNMQLYGATSHGHLIMIRGEYDFDWNNGENADAWFLAEDIHICDNHVSELGTDWQNARKYPAHINIAGKKKNVMCGVPNSVAGQRHLNGQTPRAGNRVFLQVDESLAVLRLLRVALPPGLGLCHNCKSYMKDLVVEDVIREKGYQISPDPLGFFADAVQLPRNHLLDRDVVVQPQTQSQPVSSNNHMSQHPLSQRGQSQPVQSQCPPEPKNDLSESTLMTVETQFSGTESQPSQPTQSTEPSQQSQASQSSQNSQNSQSSQNSDATYLPSPRRTISTSNRYIETPLTDEERKCFRIILTINDITRYESQLPWHLLDPKTKRRKGNQANKVRTRLYKFVTGDDDDAVEELGKLDCGYTDANTPKSEERIHKLLIILSEMYSLARNSNEKITVLMAAKPIPLEMMREYIPGLSRKQWTTARSRKIGSFQKFNKLNTRVTSVQLNYFIWYINQDFIMLPVPFGKTKQYPLSSGAATLEFPAMITQHGHTQVCRMYHQHLMDTKMADVWENTMGISTSSCLRILKMVGAVRRKSMQGIDYYSHDKSIAFETLARVVEQIRTDARHHETNNRHDSAFLDKIIIALRAHRQYLGTDFHLHIKPGSRVADHCANFGLSYPKDPLLRRPCNAMSPAFKHVDHDLQCDRCEALKNTLTTIANLVHSSVFERNSNIDKKDVLADVTGAEADINAYKAHIIRKIHADNVRQDIIANLLIGVAFLTMDWAMKFLPIRFRERQADWYAKKGMSMHITHAMFNESGIIRTVTFFHLIDADSQDAQSIVAILTDVSEKLRSRYNVHTVHLRSDNAGCYKSALLISSIPSISQKSGLFIERYTFSEAQAGKAACDRMAALAKRVCRNYVDSNHNILVAQDILTAFQSAERLGLAPYGLELDVVRIERAEKLGRKVQYKGISSLNDFEFERGSSKIRAWRHHGIGDGTMMKKGETDKFDRSTLITLGHHNLKRAPHKKNHYAYEKNIAGCDGPAFQCMSNDINNGEGIDELYPCPAPGCLKTFKRQHQLAYHVEVSGKHTRDPDSLTFRDRAAHAFVNQVEKQEEGNSITEIDEGIKEYILGQTPSVNAPLKEGHAVRPSPTRTEISPAVRDLLTDWFDEGADTGNKMSPEDAARRLNEMKDDDDKFVIPRDNKFKSATIAGFWGRLKAQREKDGANQSETLQPIEATQPNDQTESLSVYADEHVENDEPMFWAEGDEMRQAVLDDGAHPIDENTENWQRDLYRQLAPNPLKRPNFRHVEDQVNTHHMRLRKHRRGNQEDDSNLDD